MNGILKAYNKFLVFLILLIFLFWLGYFISNMMFSGFLSQNENTGEYKTVPNLITKSYEEAEKICQDNNLILISKDNNFDGKWIIVNQCPKPETFSQLGDTLYVNLKDNQQKIFFPDFRGVSLEEAIILAKENSIIINNISYIKSSEIKDKILSYAKIGESNQNFSKVNLLVSSGDDADEFYLMPNFVNHKYNDVAKYLILEGFSLSDSIQYSYFREKEEDLITKQRPSVNAKITKETPIYFEVNKQYRRTSDG